MKNKISTYLKKIRKFIMQYFSTNKLFLTFLLFTIIETVLLRKFTLRNTFAYEPFICDLALLVIIGSFGYLFKADKQFKYYMFWILVVTLMCIVNSIYYVFYTSFASFSLLAELGLVGDVGDSLIEKFRFIDFIYLFFPFFYYYIHRLLKISNYYTIRI